ncbi:MAG: ABC transporter substrate-binding protein [Salinibacterium sp.]|nr:MAG: ABC transporter substrate-binding protein [Salinibacterium sp.]
MKRKNLALAALGLAVAALLSGCTTPTATSGPPAELHLGYFANVTHAPALVGIEKGFFQDALGDTKLKTSVFNAGPATIEALSAGAIDAAYIGPSPAINTYIKSGGASAVIVSGATSGGAALVVRDGINSPSDLPGTTLATPQLGNTQDIALRAWLADQGYTTSTTGGGDVTISPTDNADTLSLFQDGKLDGAWLPEPWVSRLVLEGHAHVLVNEASLWPKSKFPTTVLLVNKDFLAAHPDTVKALVQGNVDAVDWLNDNPADAGTVINKRITADTGKGLSNDVIARALENVQFSVDPQAAAFPVLVKHAAAVDLGTDGSIDGLFDLRFLNEILSASGAHPISTHGLGKE